MSFKLAVRGFLVSLWLLAIFVLAEDCDKSQCKGPIRFYEDLRCQPIYKKSDYCCAAAYNCSHLSKRSTSRCYVNGHEYNIGERLRDEDIVNPCDRIGCFCSQEGNRIAKFSCPIVDCAIKEVKPGCYLKSDPGMCCGKEEICPTNPKDVQKCIVDGETYFDGEKFVPNNDPTLLCHCVQTHLSCEKMSCRIEQNHPFEIHENCAPIFEADQSPIKHCAWLYRCQSANDIVLHPHEEIDESESSEHERCQFGNLTLHVGDVLSRGTAFPNECVECKCEIPPTLTCKRLPREEC